MDRAQASITVALVLLLVGCTTTGPGPHWGSEATATPGWGRVGRAAVAAGTDPFTWVPAVGAAGLQIGDADREIVEWANDNRPLFGNRKTARDASDWLRAASLGLYLGTGLGAPAPEGRWPATKAKGLAVGGGALLATDGATDLLKTTVDRERPLRQDERSFPSGHTGTAAVSARLARHALGYYRLSRAARRSTDLGLVALAGMTGWARVEGGKHFPADALGGAALGNFFAVFATEAFLEPGPQRRVRLQARALPSGMVLGLSGRL